MRLALGSEQDKAADSLHLVDRKRIDLARALAMNPMLLLDEDLLLLDPIWAAAGSPSHVFRTSAADLARITGATVAAVRTG